MDRWELEVCTDDMDLAVRAAEEGATRIEFNQALSLDGLTPTTAQCRWLVKHCSVPVIAMLRPHDRGFVYSSTELAVMLEDAKALLDTGIAGLASGALSAEGELNWLWLEQLVKICGRAELVVHRVFDLVDSPVEAAIRLGGMGITRILTSGGAPTVPEGLSQLKHLHQISQETSPFQKEVTGEPQNPASIRSNSRLGYPEILPGGGIRPNNIRLVHVETGCQQFHGSFREATELGDRTSLKQVREAREQLDLLATKARSSG